MKRTNYIGSDIEEIPQEFNNIQTDIEGRKYSDFYKVCYPNVLSSLNS